MSAPEPAAAGPAADADFFVLQSFDDARLPAPGRELDTATPAELAALEPDQTPYAVTPGVEAADPHPTLFWNALTRQLASAAAQSPPLFARSYALVHVTLYDALHVTQHGCRPSMPANAVAAGAALEVLSYLFPASAATLEQTARTQAGLRHGPALAGWLVGRAVGRVAVAWGRTDGSDAVYTGTPPSGPGLWTGTNPVLPMCGTWRTWIVRTGSEFMPEPPYPFGSPEDLADVDAVYQASLRAHAGADRDRPQVGRSAAAGHLEWVAHATDSRRAALQRTGLGAGACVLERRDVRRLRHVLGLQVHVLDCAARAAHPGIGDGRPDAELPHLYLGALDDFGRGGGSDV